MCGLPAGVYEGRGRVASCFIEVPGFTSAAVALTGGTEDAPLNTILSAAPATVRIRPGEKDEIAVITAGGMEVTVVEGGSAGIEAIPGRRYILDVVSKGGRRLAWVNRYGAIDYHTFPVAGEVRSTGGRTRIYSPGGYRTVATEAYRSETLLSEPCDAATAEWLAEIFSSPAVWTVDGSTCERVEVAGGEVACSPARPSVVSVTLSCPVKTVSRKL
jgi:hypothetical protein